MGFQDNHSELSGKFLTSDLYFIQVYLHTFSDGQSISFYFVPQSNWLNQIVGSWFRIWSSDHQNHQNVARECVFEPLIALEPRAPHGSNASWSSYGSRGYLPTKLIEECSFCPLQI